MCALPGGRLPVIDVYERLNLTLDTLHLLNLNVADNCAALQLKTLMDYISLLEIRLTLFMKFTARGDTRVASVAATDFQLNTPC
jgi:hypothetical protein